MTVVCRLLKLRGAEEGSRRRRGDKMKCLEECFGSPSPKDRERYRVSIDLGTLISCAIGPPGELCKKDMASSSSIILLTNGRPFCNFCRQQATVAYSLQ